MDREGGDAVGHRAVSAQAGWGVRRRWSDSRRQSSVVSWTGNCDCRLLATMPHVLVGRLRKPHGLKGDCNLFPLTDDPAGIFAPGNEIWVVDRAGETVAGPLTVER